MPKEMEKKLRAEARKKGLSEERADAYVYGTLRKTGWTPSKEKKMPMTVGEAYDKKHGKKPKSPAKPGDKKEPKMHNMPRKKDDKAPKKYKRGGLPKPSAEAPKGKVYTDRDLGKGGPSYEKPTYRRGGANRQRWDKTKKKWVPAPK